MILKILVLHNKTVLQQKNKKSLKKIQNRAYFAIDFFCYNFVIVGSMSDISTPKFVKPEGVTIRFVIARVPLKMSQDDYEVTNNHWVDHFGWMTKIHAADNDDDKNEL